MAKRKVIKKRASRLTPKMQDEICNLLKLGMSPPKAGEMHGVHRSTMRYWLRRGRAEWHKPRSRYAKFARAVDQAAATCMQRGLLLINHAASDDYKAAAWLLERRFPEEFAPRHMVMVQTQRTIEEIVDALAQRLPPDVYHMVLTALREELEHRELAITAGGEPALEAVTM
jgi:hypothetical protein